MAFRPGAAAAAGEAYRRRHAALGKTVRERVEVPAGHRHCPTCKSIKPHAEWDRSEFQSGGFSATHLDHDHASGRVRGVLCFLCKVALGHFRDSPSLL